jgi:hypothetical protein
VGEEIIGRDYYSTSPLSEHAWLLAKEKHQRDQSIGYKVTRSVIINAGEEADIEGVHYKASADIDLRISLEWELKENSVCPIGADPAAKSRKYAGKDTQMEKFKQWLAARGLDYDKLSEQQRASLQKDYDAETARAEKMADDGTETDDKTARSDPAKKPAKTAEADNNQRTSSATTVAIDPQQAIAAERLRCSTIRELAGQDVPADVLQRALDGDTTVDAFRTIVLEHIRKARPKVKGPGLVISQGVDSRDIIIDAMLIRAGFEDTILKDKTNGERRAEVASRHRDMNLLDMCRYAINLDGGDVPLGREDTIRMAFSTASLPFILGAIANKSAMRGYNFVPATWRNWCSIGTLPDFKLSTRVRLTDTGSLEKVGAGGEIKESGAEEEYEQYRLDTYAKKFSITRQQIINDDLGAFTRTPERLGRAAAELPSDLVYTHLLANGAMSDGIVLFYATTHLNLNTSAALTMATLQAACAAFIKQKDKAGRQITIMPRVILVPPELKYTAMNLARSTTIVIAGTPSTESIRGNYNALMDDNLQVVAEPRLSNSAFSGYSATSWYVTGRGGEVDTIEVGFLNGVEQPTVEQLPSPADVLGVTYRVYLDVGVKALDFRGMQKNNQ